MASAQPHSECPFALLYQGLPAVYEGEFMETAGRCAWTLQLPDAQPRMNSAVSACVFLREGYKWDRKDRKTAPVFAKALPISADYQSVPFKHVGDLSPSIGSIFFNVSAHSMQGEFRVYATIETTDMAPSRIASAAQQATQPLVAQEGAFQTAAQSQMHASSAPIFDQHKQRGSASESPHFASPPRHQQREDAAAASSAASQAATPSSSSAPPYRATDHGMPSTPAGAASSGIGGTSRATSDWAPPRLQVPHLSQDSLASLQQDVQRSARSTARTLLSALPRPQRRADGSGRLVDPYAALHVGRSAISLFMQFLDRILHMALRAAVVHHDGELTKEARGDLAHVCVAPLDTILVHVQCNFFDIIETRDEELKGMRRSANKSAARMKLLLEEFIKSHRTGSVQAGQRLLPTE